MADEFLPKGLGFSEFATTLLEELLDGISAASLQQEQRQAETTRAAGLTPEEFLETSLATEDIDAELAALFPTTEKQHISAVYPDAPYVPADVGTESPPFLEMLGVELTDRDFNLDTRQRTAKLTRAGVDKVRNAVGIRLASDHLAAIREVVRRGFPRVVVEGGRINAKLVYEVVSGEDTEKTGLKETMAAPLKKTSFRPGRRVFGKQAADVRILVRQADERSPQATNLKHSVYGEVEIHFKTVT